MIAQRLGSDSAQLGFFRAINHIWIVFPAEEDGRLLGIIPAGIILVFVTLFVFSGHLDEASCRATHGLIFQVGGNLEDIQFVNFGKFFSFGFGCAGHTAELFIHAEVVLDGNGGVGHVLRLHADAFFSLYRLMQALGPAAARHEPTGELINNDDLTGLNNVIFVAAEEVLGFERLLQITPQARLFGVNIFRAVGVTQGDAQDFFDMRFADFSQNGVAVTFVDLDIFGAQGPHHLSHLDIPFRVIRGGAGNNQGGSGFIYEDIIHFVHDGKVVIALHALRQAHGQVVTQEIKAKFAVRAVDDICLVGFAAVHQADFVLIFEGRGFGQVNDEGLATVLGAAGHL